MAIITFFKNLIGDASSAYDCFSITPNDSTNLQFDSADVLVRGIRVGTGGNVAIRNSLGDTVIQYNCYDGEVLAIRTDRVLATGTTASNLVGLI